MLDQIYLDFNGTTPVDPEVIEAMLPYLRQHYGNPSSQSVLGQRARAGLQQAREQVATLIGAQPEEIYFTSGATESNNWVVLGSRLARVVISQIEHPSILRTCEHLETCGLGQVKRLAVDAWGQVHPRQLEGIEADLVSIMHSNNEVGTLQPIAQLAAVARAAGALFHTDAAQSLAKVDVNVKAWGVDLLTVAGHKLYAPKGIGALYIRQGVKLPPFILGAAQERGLRSGTENVAYAVGLGRACELARQRWRQDAAAMQEKRDFLQDYLEKKLGQRVSCNGHPQQRLPNTLSINFHSISGAVILQQCPQLLAATGAACHAGCVSLSHVLTAMGVEQQRAQGVVRLSLGRTTTQEHVALAAQALVQAYHRLSCA